VLARAVLGFEGEQNSDGLAFHARRATVSQFVDAVSAACALDTPSSWQGLVTELVMRDSTDVVAIAVDALDEAASDEDRSELRRALRELARVDWLRVAVATRPLTPGDVYRPGSHLHGLGVNSREDSRNLVDLDSARYFALADLVAYADALLAQSGFAKPGPAGGAWEQYRRQNEVRDRLARVVAARAGRNFLIAGMSAFQLAGDETMFDPRSPLFDPSVVPSGIGEALTKYLDGLPDETRRRVTGLLTALVYGRGAGLDAQRWLAFAKSLGWAARCFSPHRRCRVRCPVLSTGPTLRRPLAPLAPRTRSTTGRPRAADRT
jgi:hypothetical protein